jgi:hypothetical protein
MTPALFLAALLSVAGSPATNASGAPPPTQFHATTRWALRPSLKYDTLCFLNALTGDPYYLDYYKDEYERFKPQLTPQAAASLQNLKRIIKDEDQGIISASLCLYFSAVPDKNLDDMLKTLADTRALKASFEKTVYYSGPEWKVFESTTADLGHILQFLKDIRFEDYWAEEILPQEQKRIAELDGVLPKYNVVKEIELRLGHPLSSGTVTVDMLFYSQPHGIKVVGTEFLTDVAWDFSIVVRNAVHEMMHPPYDLKADASLGAAVASLGNDAFFRQTYDKRNPAYGYNTIEALIEEDCVQALEQVIAEKLGVALDAKERWRQNDEGMHVFAAALYETLRQSDYKAPFDQYLLDALRTKFTTKGYLKAQWDLLYR